MAVLVAMRLALGLLVEEVRVAHSDPGAASFACAAAKDAFRS